MKTKGIQACGFGCSFSYNKLIRKAGGVCYNKLPCKAGSVCYNKLPCKAGSVCYNKVTCGAYWHLASRKERKDMHMADALVAPAVAGTMYACSGAAMGYSMKKVRR